MLPNILSSTFPHSVFFLSFVLEMAARINDVDKSESKEKYSECIHPTPPRKTGHNKTWAEQAKTTTCRSNLLGVNTSMLCRNKEAQGQICTTPARLSAAVQALAQTSRKVYVTICYYISIVMQDCTAISCYSTRM